MLPEAESFFKDLEIAYEPDNIYFQTISSILESAEKIKMPRSIQLILTG